MNVHSASFSPKFFAVICGESGGSGSGGCPEARTGSLTLPVMTSCGPRCLIEPHISTNLDHSPTSPLTCFILLYYERHTMTSRVERAEDRLADFTRDKRILIVSLMAVAVGALS